MIEVGRFAIARVEESVLDEDPSIFKHFDDDVLERNRDWMVPGFFNEERRSFQTMIHSWVVRTPDRTIVVDTCGGDHKDRPVSPRFHEKETGFAERLAEAGVEAEKVDLVILTHLHVDHVGWNTRLEGDRWVPMFPNAEYLVCATELEANDPERGAANKSQQIRNIFLDSIKPVLDAGLMREVQGTETVMPGIDLVPLAGHSPGMMGMRVRGNGKEVMFVGDMMHQPLQICHPDWNSKYCEDQGRARETRHKVLDHAADNRVLLAPAHFVDPHCAYVHRDSGGYRPEWPELNR